MIKINPSAYSSVFIIPSSVADKHIRLAGAVQLKALIWIFRHSAENPDIQDVSSALGIPCADISDALQYWAEAGIISLDDSPGSEASEETKAAKAPANTPNAEKCGQISFFDNSKPVRSEAEKKPSAAQDTEESAACEAHRMPPAVRPTHEQIAARITESREVRDMFFETERIFGRTLGYDTQSSLLYLMDHEGLPPEVIVMLCEYAQSIGKKSVRYIEKIGEDWAEKEIDTFEKAAKRIASLENVNALWNELKIMMGLDNPKPTSKQSEYLLKWSDTYGFSAEFIYFAYERMMDKTGKLNFKYMDAMLSAWHASGFKSKEEVEAEDEKFREKTVQAKKSASQPKTRTKASYDIKKAFGSGEIPTKTKKGG